MLRTQVWEEYLIVMATVADDVDGLNDIRVLESGTDTELGSDLLLVFLFCLTGSFGPKLFDGEDGAVVLSLDQPDSTTRTRSKDSAPFAILLCEVRLCSLGERCDRIGGAGGRLTARRDGRGM